jgi:hypothetical protein
LGLSARFWDKVTKSADCWLWTGAKVSKGYGSIRIDRKTCAAHRVAWELEYGSRVPEDLTLDHRCRTRNCVRPSHLEAVTDEENNRRRIEFYKSIVRPTLTHCVQGHELCADNVYVTPKGTRRCRICIRQAGRKHDEKRRVAIAA